VSSALSLNLELKFLRILIFLQSSYGFGQSVVRSNPLNECGVYAFELFGSTTNPPCQFDLNPCRPFVFSLTGPSVFTVFLSPSPPLLLSRLTVDFEALQILSLVFPLFPLVSFMVCTPRTGSIFFSRPPVLYLPFYRSRPRQPPVPPSNTLSRFPPHFFSLVFPLGLVRRNVT